MFEFLGLLHEELVKDKNSGRGVDDFITKEAILYIVQ